MKNKSARLLRLITGAILAGTLILLSGCSIQSAGLTPPELPAAERRIEKTLKIMPVAGGRKSSFGREAYITNEKYHSALLETMKKSALFRDTVTSGDADLELFSEIITITTESGLSPTYAIVVQYWLVDPSTGEEIWRKGINTRHQVMWNDHFAGATRIIKAVEGATQKNLTQLTQGLAEADL